MSQKPPSKPELTPVQRRKETWRRRSLQVLRVLEWVLWLALGVVLVSSLTIGGALWWLSKTHQQSQPLNLDPWLPRVEKLAKAQGVPLQVDHLEAYFDDGVVLHAAGVDVSGPVTGGGSEPGLVLEEIAVRLSSRRLFAFEVSPKKIEARGLTLKMQLHDKQLRIAGLVNADVDNLPPLSVVSFLNSLPRDATWGALKKVTVGDVTLLFQDDDHHAGWVLEQGQAKIRRDHGVGETLKLNASLRQLYGKAVLVADASGSNVNGTVAVPAVHAVQAMPVVLGFDHPHGSDKATLGLVFSHAQLGLVAAYLPPKFGDMIRGSGEVGLQTTLDSNDKIEEPGVDLHLHDVTITPPDAYSHPLSFSRLDVLATYLPSPTDILQVRRLEGVYGSKTLFRVRGDVRDLGGDPLINLAIESPAGQVTDVIDFLPDLQIKEAVGWLHANLKSGNYTNLRGRYTGRPSAMPNCGDLCGISVDGNLQGLAMTFLKGLPEASEISGTLNMRGKTVTIAVPSAKVGHQQVVNANVRVTDLFEPLPVRLLVNSGLTGDAGELTTALMTIAKAKDLPLKLSGVQSTSMTLSIPLPKGRDADISEMGILATTRLTKAKLEQAPYLPGSYATDSTTIVVGEDRRVRIASTGTLLAETEKGGGAVVPVPTQLQISDTLDHFGSALEIAAKGSVPGSWLGKTMQISGQVSLTGPVGVNGTLQKLPDGWQFDVNADGGQLAANWPTLKWQKAKDAPLKIQARGAYHEPAAKNSAGARVQLANLKLDGGTNDNPIKIAGSLDIWPDQFARSNIALQPLVLGRNDITLELKNQNLAINGRQLDISQFDLLGNKNDPASSGRLMKQEKTPVDKTFDKLVVAVNIQKILAEHGVLTNVVANLQNTAGRWDVNRLQMEVDKGGKVNMTQQALPNGGKQLNIAVYDTGQVLSTLGVYDGLVGGALKGQFNYSAPTKATGKLTMTSYQLKNPPLLAKLLGLLSLQQLLAGTSTILFNTANVPLKLDGDMVWLDNAEMVGPTMSLQLDGSLDRRAGQLDMDGKVAPAIPFNRLVAQIPVLGTLLTGSQDGLVAADFKLKGSTDDPQISVHPLSLITPGLVKDAWHSLTAKPREGK